MGYAIAVVLSLAAGFVLGMIYKAKTLAAKEAAKSGLIKEINKL